MTATQAQRSRALRLRRKRAEGTITTEESAELDAYIARQKPSPIGKRPGWVAEHRAAQVQGPAQPPESPAMDPTAAQIPPGEVELPDDEDDEDDEDDASDEAPETTPTPEPGPSAQGGGAPGPQAGAPPPQGHQQVIATDAPMSCGRADCIACSGAVGGYKCATTGVVVWPPIKKPSAKLLATGLLFLVSLLVKLAREDKRRISATPAEIDELAEAIIAVTHRRINAIGAIDDIMHLIGALGMYGMRAASEPTQLAKAA